MNGLWGELEASSIGQVFREGNKFGGNIRSRCFLVSDIRVNLSLKIASIEICTLTGFSYRRDCIHHISADPCSRRREYVTSSPSSHHTFCTAEPQNRSNHGDSDSGSDGDCEPDPNPDSKRPQQDSTSMRHQMETLKEAVSPVLSNSSERLEPESWTLIDGEDAPTVVSTLPMTKRYAPRRLLEFIAKKVDSKMFSPAQLKKALMFWQKKEKLEEDTPFASSAFGEKGVSQIYQWTATDLTLQHVRLTRIARDVLYLVLACSLLGIVRVLEAVSATFSTSPPHFSKLLDAANSLDFFTMAFLAYGVRKPVIGILRVDPTNLDEVVHLKAKIWDEMHKFYERQWKAIATLAVGRLLALIAQKLPSTNLMTRSIKMCWDFLLALPIF
ncbi:hypothetical protein GOP47_0014716 [Adiantum capillus-veneris]|uniref:Uncharacterized protein n=1 Tax=Adiantum capillus-veneris TaxID=13818 RepID=A0A9D4ZCF3_ADICA|nr:hypothetical protein GOP47_0014716 [Adiantum capillus-veneris]